MQHIPESNLGAFSHLLDDLHGSPLSSFSSPDNYGLIMDLFFLMDFFFSDEKEMYPGQRNFRKFCTV